MITTPFSTFKWSHDLAATRNEPKQRCLDHQEPPIDGNMAESVVDRQFE